MSALQLTCSQSSELAPIKLNSERIVESDEDVKASTTIADQRRSGFFSLLVDKFGSDIARDSSRWPEFVCLDHRTAEECRKANSLSLPAGPAAATTAEDALADTEDDVFVADTAPGTDSRAACTECNGGVADTSADLFSPSPPGALPPLCLKSPENASPGLALHAPGSPSDEHAKAQPVPLGELLSGSVLQSPAELPSAQFPSYQHTATVASPASPEKDVSVSERDVSVSERDVSVSERDVSVSECRSASQSAALFSDSQPHVSHGNDNNSRVMSPPQSVALFSEGPGSANADKSTDDGSSLTLCNGQIVMATATASAMAADTAAAAVETKPDVDLVPPTFLPSFCSTPSRRRVAGRINTDGELATCDTSGSFTTSTVPVESESAGKSAAATPSFSSVLQQPVLRWSKSLETPIDSQFNLNVTAAVSPDAYTTGSDGTTFDGSPHALQRHGQGTQGRGISAAITPSRSRQPHGRVLFTGGEGGKGHSTQSSHTLWRDQDRGSEAGDCEGGKGKIESEVPSGDNHGAPATQLASSTSQHKLHAEHARAASCQTVSTVSAQSCRINMPETEEEQQPASSEKLSFECVLHEQPTPGAASSGRAASYSPSLPGQPPCTPISGMNEEKLYSELALFSEHALFSDYTQPHTRVPMPPGAAEETSGSPSSSAAVFRDCTAGDKRSPAQLLSGGSVVKTAAVTSALSTATSPPGVADTPDERRSLRAIAAATPSTSRQVPMAVDSQAPEKRGRLFCYPDDRDKSTPMPLNAPCAVVPDHPAVKSPTMVTQLRQSKSLPQESGASPSTPAAVVPSEEREVQRPPVTCTPTSLAAQEVVDTSNKNGPATFRMLSGRAVQVSEDELVKARLLLEADVDDALQACAISPQPVHEQSNAGLANARPDPTRPTSAGIESLAVTSEHHEQSNANLASTCTDPASAGVATAAVTGKQGDGVDSIRNADPASADTSPTVRIPAPSPAQECLTVPNISADDKQHVATPITPVARHISADDKQHVPTPITPVAHNISSDDKQHVPTPITAGTHSVLADDKQRVPAARECLTSHSTTADDKQRVPVPITPVAHSATSATACRVVQSSNKTGVATFRMLSGRSAVVSERGLEQAKQILKDVDEELGLVAEPKHQSSETMSTPRHIRHETASFKAPRPAPQLVSSPSSDTAHQVGVKSIPLPENSVKLLETGVYTSPLALTDQEIDNLSAACVSVPFSPTSAQDLMESGAHSSAATASAGLSSVTINRDGFPRVPPSPSVEANPETALPVCSEPAAGTGRGGTADPVWQPSAHRMSDSIDEEALVAVLEGMGSPHSDAEVQLHENPSPRASYTAASQHTCGAKSTCPEPEAQSSSLPSVVASVQPLQPAISSTVCHVPKADLSTCVSQKSNSVSTSCALHPVQSTSISAPQSPSKSTRSEDSDEDGCVAQNDYHGSVRAAIEQCSDENQHTSVKALDECLSPLRERTPSAVDPLDCLMDMLTGQATDSPPRSPPATNSHAGQDFTDGVVAADSIATACQSSSDAYPLLSDTKAGGSTATAEQQPTEEEQQCFHETEGFSLPSTAEQVCLAEAAFCNMSGGVAYPKLDSSDDVEDGWRKSVSISPSACKSHALSPEHAGIVRSSMMDDGSGKNVVRDDEHATGSVTPVQCPGNAQIGARRGHALSNAQRTPAAKARVCSPSRFTDLGSPVLQPPRGLTGLAEEQPCDLDESGMNSNLFLEALDMAAASANDANQKVDVLPKLPLQDAYRSAKGSADADDSGVASMAGRSSISPLLLLDASAHRQPDSGLPGGALGKSTVKESTDSPASSSRPSPPLAPCKKHEQPGGIEGISPAAKVRDSGAASVLSADGSAAKSLQPGLSPVCAGFFTAAGSPILVSAKAYARASNVLDDVWSDPQYTSIRGSAKKPTAPQPGIALSGSRNAMQSDGVSRSDCGQPEQCATIPAKTCMPEPVRTATTDASALQSERTDLQVHGVDEVTVHEGMAPIEADVQLEDSVLELAVSSSMPLSPCAAPAVSERQQTPLDSKEGICATGFSTGRGAVLSVSRKSLGVAAARLQEFDVEVLQFAGGSEFAAASATSTVQRDSTGADASPRVGDYHVTGDSGQASRPADTPTPLQSGVGNAKFELDGVTSVHHEVLSPHSATSGIAACGAERERVKAATSTCVSSSEIAQADTTNDEQPEDDMLSASSKRTSPACGEVSPILVCASAAVRSDARCAISASPACILKHSPVMMGGQLLVHSSEATVHAADNSTAQQPWHIATAVAGGPMRQERSSTASPHQRSVVAVATTTVAWEALPNTEDDSGKIVQLTAPGFTSVSDTSTCTPAPAVACAQSPLDDDCKVDAPIRPLPPAEMETSLSKTYSSPKSESHYPTKAACNSTAAEVKVIGDMLSVVGAGSGVEPILSSSSSPGLNSSATIPTMTGFKTAAGKAVSISEKSMALARKRANEDSDGIPPVDEDSTDRPDVSIPPANNSKSTQALTGFKTGAGRSVSVSATAMALARKRAHEDSHDVPPIVEATVAVSANHPAPSSPVPRKPSTLSVTGFKTGAGKSVSVSAKSLALAQKRAHDDSGDDLPPIIKAAAGVVTPKRPSSTTPSLKRPRVTGFNAPARKSVSISETPTAQKQPQAVRAQSESSSTATETAVVSNSPSSVPISSANMLTVTGFKTGTGKSVSVSEKSLALAQRRARDDTSEDTLPAIGTSSVEMPLNPNSASPEGSRLATTGFKTGAGQRVSVSAKAMALARKRARDDSEDVPSIAEAAPTVLPKQSESSNLLMNNSTDALTMTGFKTDAGKSVTNSTDALTMTGFKTGAGKSVTNSTDALTMTGFKTGAGKSVSISAKSLALARKRAHDDSGDDIDASRQIGDQSSTTGEQCVTAFHSATGSELAVSRKANECASKIFSDDDADGGSVTSRSSNSALPMTTGFTTAAGKSVSVSSELLDTARALFGDSPMPLSKRRKHDGTMPGKGPNESAVRTDIARSTDVPALDKKSLDVACAMLGNDLTGHDRAPGHDGTLADAGKSSSKPLMPGFSTAGGGKVLLSQESLHFIRSQHDACDGDGDKRDVSPHALAIAQFTAGNQNGKPAVMPGFSTASGTEVSVNKASLAAVQAALQANSEASRPPSHSFGFSTAAGKAVGVSDKSMAFAKSFWSDDTAADAGKDAKTHQQSGSGDGTATGQQQFRSPTGSAVPRQPVASVRSSVATTQIGVHLASACSATATTAASGDAVTPVIPKTRSHRTSLKTDKRGGGGACGSPCVDASTMAMHGGHDQVPTAAAPATTPSMKSHRKSLAPSRSTPSEFLRDRAIGLSRMTPQRCLPRESRGASSSSSSSALSNISNVSRRHGVAGQSPFNTPFRQVTPRHPDKAAIHRPSSSSAKSNPTEAAGDSKQQATSSKGSCRPQIGRLLQARQDGQRIRLASLSGGPPEPQTRDELLMFGVSEETLSVSSRSAGAFRFTASNFFSSSACQQDKGIRLADGGWLEITENTVRVEDIGKAFFSTPGVDKRLVSDAWVRNHYRWIVWSLAAQEVAAASQLGGRLLTPENVLLRLKYRYDREIDRAQRSALKKIFELDDSPAQAMVLCVSDILPAAANTAASASATSIANPASASSAQTPSSNVATPTPTKPARSAGGIATTPASASATAQSGTKTTRDQAVTPGTAEPTDPPSLAHVELTDGWYKMPATLDAPLLALVRRRVIRPGTKLFLIGSEFSNPPQATPPLEAPATVCLKLCMNSTRRARWDAKLGFHRSPQPFTCTKLNGLSATGGRVPMIDVVVQRKYPTLWMEREAESGRCIFRSTRAEETLKRLHDQQREALAEGAYERALKECDESDDDDEDEDGGITSLAKRRRLTSERLTELETGSQLYRASKTASDPDSFLMDLNECQLAALNAFRLQKREKRRIQIHDSLAGELQSATRNVSSVLAVRVVGLQPSPSQRESLGTMLSVWRPTEDVEQLLAEGSCLRITSLTASHAKGRRMAGSVQLAVTRTTRYDVITDPAVVKYKDDVYIPRQLIGFGDLDKYKAAILPPFQEVDVVGIVVLVSSGSVSHSNADRHPTAFLANSEHQLVAITLCNDLQHFAWNELLTVGKTISAYNLTWSAQQLGVPTLRTSDLSALSSNPREQSTRKALQQLRSSSSPEYVDTMTSCAQDVLALRDETLDLVTASQDLPRPRTMTPMPAPTSTEHAKDPAKEPASTMHAARQSPAGGTSASAKRKHACDVLESYPSPPPLQELPHKPPRAVLKEFKSPAVRKT